MEVYFRIAGIEISMQIRDADMPENMGFLDVFRVSTVTDPHLYVFTRVDRLPAPTGTCIFQSPSLSVYSDDVKEYRYFGDTRESWENAMLCGIHQGKNHRIYVRLTASLERLNAKILLSAMAMEHLMTMEHGLILHASYVAWKNGAILFTAPSGTGKSTQADLWVKHRGAKLINGDRAGIRVTEKGVLAYGLPFAGSSTICKDVTLPILAIVYLNQAPQTSISRLSVVEAFRRIWEGCSINTWNAEDVERSLETVTHVVEAIPVYYMPCTPDESAVAALECVLEQQVIL